MAKRGRPKKSTEAHILDGTYQQCRHGNNIDIVISDILQVPEKIEIPDAIKKIKNKTIEKAFGKHVAMLIALKVFYYPDLPELINLYLILNDIYKTREALNKLNCLENTEKYLKLNALFLRQAAAFNNIGSKFYLNPQDRTQMTLGNLQALNENLKLKKKLQEAKTNPIIKLANNKKN